MRAILPAIATLAILCAACSDSASSPSADNREAVASVVGGVTYPLVAITPAVKTLSTKDSTTVQAKLTDANGSWTGRFISWKSSDTTILRVRTTGTGTDAGSVAHVTALKSGSATISATTQSQTSDKKTVVIALSQPGSVATKGDTVVAKVSVTPNPVNIASSKTYQLVGAAYNAAGTPIPTAKLTWHSTNTAILTVSASGLITGVSKGTANIEGSASNGKMAWSTVTDTGGVVTSKPGNPTPPTGPTSPTPPTTTGQGVAAVWSDKFVGSVGVATHFSYYDLLPYGNNRSATIASIKNAGIRFIRDGLSVDVNQGSNDLYWGIMKNLVSQGIKLVLVTQPVYLGNNTWVKAPYTNQSNIDTAVNRVGAAGILAFEGPNEVDNNNDFWGGIPGYGTATKQYMASMYQRVKQIAPSVTVIGLTTTSSYGSSFIGDISSYMDAGTLHPYPGGGIPTASLASTISNSSVLNAAHKPWWVTETGYYTALNPTQNVYQPGVSEAAQAKYVSRLYLDYFNAGIVHTSVYEAIDERSDGVNAEDNYGLMHNDGSPKPAYNTLKNLLGLLADPGSAYTPSALAYTLSGVTSTVRQSLFQKRDGRFYLVLWNDVSVFNTSGKSDISTAAVPVTVTFSTKPSAVTRYQPYVSAAGTPLTAATTVSVSVVDNPIVLEISR